MPDNADAPKDQATNASILSPDRELPDLATSDPPPTPVEVAAPAKGTETVSTPRSWGLLVMAAVLAVLFISVYYFCTTARVVTSRVRHVSWECRVQSSQGLQVANGRDEPCICPRQQEAGATPNREVDVRVQLESGDQVGFTTNDPGALASLQPRRTIRVRYAPSGRFVGYDD